MKNCILSFATCVAAIIFTSCSKEDTHQPDQPQKTTMEVSITAELDEFAPTTKATAEACIRLKWEGGETVYAYSALSSGKLSDPATLTASISDNAYVAVLKGTITAPTDANKTLYLVYSGCGTPSISGQTVTVAMNGTQASDKVPFVAYAKLTGVTGTDYSTDGLQAKFNFASSVINVNVTGLGSGMSLSSAAMSGLATNCTIAFDDDIEVGNSGDKITYTKTLSGTATTSGKAQFFLAVPEMDASSSRTLTVTDGTNTYIDNGVVSGAHSANSYINTICCCQKAVKDVLLSGEFSVSDTKKVQFTRGNLYWDGSAYHIEEEQTDYDKGTYDNLTEKTTYTSIHVSHFFWTNLTDYQSGTASYMPYASSYSYNNGYNDDKRTTSDTFFCGVNNPMTVDGQSGLYALSNDEWTYLINSRTSGLYKYGVTVSNGGTDYTNCLIIAPDDFTGTLSSSYTLDAVNASGLVCLPAAGFRNGSGLSEGGSRGDYWSATPNGSSYAYDLYFNGSSVQPSDDDNFRNNGYSVRLVYSEATPVYPEAPSLACVKIGDVWWAPVNCGYSTSETYGLLYQWGRKYGQSNDGTITPTSPCLTMADGQLESNKDKFSTYDTSTYNWFTGTVVDTLWNGSSKGTYDPCPTGWRVPTEAEFTALISQKAWGNNTVGTVEQTGYWFNGSSAATAGTGVFLPAAGCRSYFSGSANFRGGNGYYWSSSVYGNDAWDLSFLNGNAYMDDNSRAGGYSVRCVQE